MTCDSDKPLDAAATRKRVTIEAVAPEIDGGAFLAKRIVGDRLRVEADIFVDGHDLLVAQVLYRRPAEADWKIAAMQPLVNDRWQAEFPLPELGCYLYTIEAWIDRFRTWQRDVQIKAEAGQDLAVEFLMGADLIAAAQKQAAPRDAQGLGDWARALSAEGDRAVRLEQALDPELTLVMGRYPDRRFITAYDKTLTAVVDPVKARFSTWYEMFPRSAAREPGRHGTFGDCEARLAYVAHLGFDVLYFPPIHPIGTTHRKGRNNAMAVTPEDVGSPWAIGAAAGGHRAVHPQLGTLDDFRRLVSRARDYGIDIALDMAFQASPDHPCVREHPGWFSWRPDHTVQYAENPPKKYEDIYPFNFETEDWEALWQELKEVLLFWIDQGVRIFRVDNPHTKPFPFWEWLIAGIKASHPETIFLAEAFTRPKVMYRLAKLGFSQSYTFFAWRNTKWELTHYFTELTQSGVKEYFRPNLWPNTPDILTEYLQFGGAPAFRARLVLAATLGANYGIYGPPFEQCLHEAKEPGGEEYADAEKYEIKYWDLDQPGSLKEFIARVNRLRRENPALQQDLRLRFFPIDNEQLICYAKYTADLTNIILVVVNLNPHLTQGGWLELPLEDLGLNPRQPYQVHDLLGEARFLWHGPKNYVELNPLVVPAHVFRIRRLVRTERDFDYYL